MISDVSENYIHEVYQNGYEKGKSDTIDKIKQDLNITLGYITGELLRSKRDYPEEIRHYYCEGVTDFVDKVVKIISEQLKE